ncbi:IS1182 family transposase [Nocardiopsis sp. EMB25]|uniref:IS1182 family transposase n=1 Tax=Nocardiopsis sp. EMB25 TaxID=2835867 RepID=UPI002285027B|nr:IS1182 family transposase [Nocardiopsis sp. EMB25]MCY9782432.1 IS1182 family transposase [Nocardiopsis sp. EMB25]
MSMSPRNPHPIPAQTAHIARAAFPRASLAIRVRDELGEFFHDADFADLYPRRGQPAWPPGRLALVAVLQFVEGLTDRQTAEAVRARIDWKYALGLELTDPGFDHSVLSEFRDRLIDAGAQHRVLDSVLAAARDHGLLTGGRRMRTDSTHVLSAARDLNWLELVGETLRRALNAVASQEPDWLATHAPTEWFTHYATRVEDSRFPKSPAKRAEVGQRIGDDGTHLLNAVDTAQAPPGLRDLPEVECLRRVWEQHFHQVEGQVRRRAPKERPPSAERLVTPYDPEARTGAKRDLLWSGYKVHLTETCEADAPHLITNVTTTDASVSDDRMAAVVHAGLAERGLLPAEHWVDSGYANAAALATARRDHGVELHGPLKSVTNAQTRGDAAYSQDAFVIDWDAQSVRCPHGRTSTGWGQGRSQAGLAVIRVRFSPADCRTCPALRDCVSSPKAQRRELTLRPRADHEVLHEARVLQSTGEWKERYKVRAGVEGAVSQGVQAHGLRRSRYRGLAKTGLQHQITGAAMNLVRIDAHLRGMPRARTRTSPVAALRPAG